MTKYIQKLANIFVAYLYDIWSYAHDLRRVILRNHFDYEQVFCKLEEDGVDRLAFVVPHPSEVLEFSMRHLVEGLLASRYTVLFAVGSDSAAAWVKDEFPEVYVVPRQVEGRDFGVWQDLILELLKHEKLAKTLDRLLVVNDSLYFNEFTSALIKQITESERHWSCLYESFEPSYHAQSFVIAFDNFAINSPAFAKYWNEYLPFRNRRHVIKRGEIRLSKVLVKELGIPFCLIDSKALCDKIDGASPDEIRLLLHIMTTNLQLSGQYGQQLEKIEKLLGLDAKSSIEKDVGLEWFNQSLKSMIIKGCELQNPTHSVGLIANRLMGAPLKRDLAYRGTYQIADLLRFARGYSESEIQFMTYDLRSRALPISIRGFKRILFNTGRI